MGQFNSFPIENKKFSELVETTSIDGTEQLAVVDGGVSSRVTVDNLVAKYNPPNVVIIKSEADFPAPVSGVITLVNNTIYRISGQVLMSNRLEIPVNGIVELEGGSYAIDELIYLGNDTFISGAGIIQQCYIFDLKITGATGLATGFDLAGDITFVQRGELVFVGGQMQNFLSFGTVQNMTTVVLRRFFTFQCGQLTVDNVFALTSNALLWQNFVSVGAYFNILTNLSQAEFTGIAMFPTKGDSPFNVDPAINPTSGFSIGPAVPYQGTVFRQNVSYADAGGGNTTVTVSQGHSFQNSDIVLIQDSINYNGGHVISNVTLTTFDIPVAFVSDDGFGLSVLLNGAGTAPEIVPFFRVGTTGSITAYATNGAGGTTVTSTAHGQLDGQTLFIDDDPSGDYFGGYAIFNATANTFDIATPFTQDDGTGTWDTGSLDQTNNVITTANTGGIIPDSQTVGQMNIPTSVTVSIGSIGVPVIVNDANTGGTNIWSSNLTERFRFDASSGTLTHIGRAARSIEIITTSTVQKVGGGSDVIATFIAIDGTVLPESKQTTQSSDPTGVTSIAELTVQPNQTISLAVQNDSSTSNIIVDISNLIIRG
jgi:hypothetical protein